jgi:predicted nucleic acid-binding Zn ribbon protein
MPKATNTHCPICNAPIVRNCYKTTKVYCGDKCRDKMAKKLKNEKKT